MASLCRICMIACLKCAPIVPCDHDNRVDPIHNALVLRGCAIGVYFGEVGGFDNALNDLFAIKLIR